MISLSSITLLSSSMTAYTVRLRPQRIVLSHDLTILNNPSQLVHDSLMHIRLLADHGVVLVVAVVGVPEFAVWSELELQKLMSKLSLVPNIVTQVEIVRHRGYLSLVEVNQ